MFDMRDVSRVAASVDSSANIDSEFEYCDETSLGMQQFAHSSLT